MRNSRTIALSPGRDATIQEARVCDVRRLLALLPDDAAQTDLAALLRDRLPDLIDILGAGLTLPTGESIDGLPVSECHAILLAWWELHRDFLLPLLAAVVAGPSASAISTASVSS